jgi:uncharacterized repeat protein (TIGR01451 family)
MLLAIGVSLVLASTAAANTISSSGPLTNITISPDLNCSVNHTGDAAGEWFDNTACGTLAVDLSTNTLYGPAFIPAGGSASPLTPYTAVNQTGPTGSGTSGDPYKIVTVADLGSSGLRITQTDTYVVGQESYRTDVQISNSNNSSRSVRLYAAGDCYLQSSDFGYGRVDGSAVACTATTDPSSRIEQLYPLTSGSHYMETFYDTMWARIGAQQPGPDTCDCSTNEDNAILLSWDVSVPASGSVVVSHLTTFSPLGVQPLTTTKTADSATATPGGSDGYTITIANPNATPVPLSSFSDTLPAGFAYVTGSTTGATTSNPTVVGQTLTWNGSFSVPAGGNLSLHFGVTASSTPDTYYNNAGGDAGSVAVAPTGPTAPVTVAGVTLPPTMLNVSSATGDFADATTVSATLTNGLTAAPIPGKSVTLTLNGSESCTGTTNAAGTASCSITPGEAAGPYLLTGSFAGDSSYQASAGSASFMVTHEETSLAYTGDTSALNGNSMTLSAKLTTDDPSAGTALAGRTVMFMLGSGGSAQSCSGTTDSSGSASCTIGSVSQTVGPVPIAASFAGDAFYQPATASSSASIFPPTGLGAFVIGDRSASGSVYFWGSQWGMNNVLSGGPAPSAMKGFADSPTPSLACGGTFTTRPGNSSAPPSSLPSQIEVIVASKVTKKGSTISGTISHIVMVNVNPGYGNAPGHVGTGTIAGVVC